MEKKHIGLALVLGGALFALSSKASARGRSREEGDGDDDAEPVGDNVSPDLCSNNARRRDMTHFHDRMDELVDVESYGSQERLHPEAAVAYNAMLRAARSEGFDEPLFQVASGYRSLASQTRLWNTQLEKQRQRHPEWSNDQLRAEARKWVAPPGYSDHETGCAVDMWLGYGISGGNNDAIRSTAAYQWLAENAWRFGFCEYAYVDAKHPGEAWHWKYILRSVR